MLLWWFLVDALLLPSHNLLHTVFHILQAPNSISIPLPLRGRRQHLLFLRFQLLVMIPLTFILFLQMHLLSKEKASLLFPLTLVLDHTCLLSRSWLCQLLPFLYSFLWAINVSNFFIQKTLDIHFFSPLSIWSFPPLWTNFSEGSSVLYLNIPKAFASSLHTLKCGWLPMISFLHVLCCA